MHTILQQACAAMRVAAALSIFAATNHAFASEIAIKFVNKSGQTLTSINAIPNSGGDPQTILSSDLANSSSASVSFASADENCVFTLEYKFANETTTTVPDSDLCQTDQILVE